MDAIKAFVWYAALVKEEIELAVRSCHFIYLQTYTNISKLHIPATSLTCRILVVFPKTWFFDQTAFFFVACLFLVFYKFRRVKPALGSNDPVTSQLCQAVPQGNRFRSSSWLHITLRLEMPLFSQLFWPRTSHSGWSVFASAGTSWAEIDLEKTRRRHIGMWLVMFG